MDILVSREAGMLFSLLAAPLVKITGKAFFNVKHAKKRFVECLWMAVRLILRGRRSLWQPWTWKA